ncbi:MAG TPA: hypothetical protein VHO25_06065, partial [Polyangiaceae bacterium]|nr:hypothetical protein [Polyangiaceae bacterium]
VTSYKIYRSLSTNTNPANATLIATVAAPTVEYDDPVDGDLAVGTTYNYWVTATNGSDTSAYSNYDVGSADAPTTTLDAIADLAATQGFSSGPGGIISLVWTAPSGATKFDVYRHTANDFSAATKIASDYVPEDATTKLIATTSPDSIWNNGGGKIVYFHTPPLPTVQYYFWVVAKKDSPPALSEESNEALGWVVTQYLPYGTGVMQIGRGVTKEEGVDFVGTTIRVVLFGGGGGGAGGSEAYGGGGGGGPAVVVEEFTIGLGDILSLVCTPDADITSNAAATADGDNGAQVEFQINGVTVMTAKAGSGGDFSASGGGGGGAGSTGSTGDVAPTIYEGTAGNPGVGPAGGASGYRFGSRRLPAAHYFGFGVGSWNGDASGAGAAGGGSKASPGAGVLATGGRGATGYAVVAYGP